MYYWIGFLTHSHALSPSQDARQKRDTGQLRTMCKRGSPVEPELSKGQKHINTDACVCVPGCPKKKPMRTSRSRAMSVDMSATLQLLNEIIDVKSISGVWLKQLHVSNCEALGLRVHGLWELGLGLVNVYAVWVHSGLCRFCFNIQSLAG